ncbi:MAG: universal stress protein [Burkholderiaceae bacterium]
MSANPASMFKRLLVPLDGAELTPRAIDVGIALASQLGAAIAGFIAEPPVPVPSPSSGANAQAQGPTASVQELLAVERAQRLLRRFEEQARRTGVVFDGHFEHTSDVAQAIVHAALQYDCDMIVMVTHGRGAVGRLLFGSYTQQVLARSTVPVLVMH